MTWLLQLGPLGLIVGSLILLVNTLVAAFFQQRNKFLSRRSKRLTAIEPVFLDLLHWTYEVRAQAARQGRTLPPIPESLTNLSVDEEPYVEEQTLRSWILRQPPQPPPPSPYPRQSPSSGGPDNGPQ